MQGMFEQVNSTFQKDIVDHTVAAQQQFKYVHSPLEISLRDTIKSASSMIHTLSGEFTESQRKFLSLLVFGVNSQSTNPLNHKNNGSLLHEKIEKRPDPTK